MMIDFEVLRKKYQGKHAVDVGLKLTGNRKLDQHANTVFHDLMNLIMKDIEEMSKETKKPKTDTKAFKAAVKSVTTAKKATKD